MSDEIILSPDGKKKLVEELEHLKKNKRREVAERISTAKEFGDLSENAEYHEAKDEQAFIEGRILELEHLLKIATVVAAKKSKTANVGSSIELQKNGSTMNLRLVGATEADPGSGKISVDSPLGNAVFGKNEGEDFELQTPGGLAIYKIISIK